MSPETAPRRGPSRRVLAVVYSVLIALVWIGTLNVGCRGPLILEPLHENEAPLVTDEHLELARTYAPWILHGVDRTRGRQDIPTRVDFDGNLVGRDNWDNFPFFPLPPTVYYAVVETETHLFLSYHLFHPRDWAPVRLGVNDTHENDGENLQVVVDKGSGLPILLFTQAHFRGGAYAHPGGDFDDGDVELRGDFTAVDDDGRPSPTGRRVCVYVEPQGHGIYGLASVASEVQLDAAGRATFDDHGLVFRPAAAGEAIAEPALDPTGPVPYQLESTVAKLLPGVLDGSLVGRGGLLDGVGELQHGLLALSIPRYYEADRFSGPFGPDRGISPFAVDFGFGKGEASALFFDPARRYAELLTVPETWSLEYVVHPVGMGGGQ